MKLVFCKSCGHKVDFKRQAIDLITLWENGQLSGNIQCSHCGETVAYIGIKANDKL
jgi:ribosomal protein S27E